MSASEEESRGPVIRDRRRIDPVTGQVRQPAQASGTGQAPRGPGQARPGKHSVSKPGSLRQEAAGAGQPAGEAAPESGAAGHGAAGSGQDTADGGQNADAASGTAGSDGAASDLAVKLAERTADLQRVQAEYANYRKRVDRDRTAVRELALASVLIELLPVLDDIGRARDHDELTGGFKAIAESLESAVGKLGLTTFGKAGEAFDPNVHEALMHAYSADVTEPTCVQVLQPGYKVGERILRPARVAVAEPTDPAGARTASDDTLPAESSQDDTPGEADATDRTPDEGD
ncbi:MAG TPA: nucleotide exchange factor GrpE [Streptosporangiaceae bacterium]|nr:nucleotide exchange factor GrpE [Streptosporangiaceae bacterium]